MKKIFLIVIAISGLVISSFAQDDKPNQESNGARKSFIMGIKAGTNFASIYNLKGEDLKADGKFGIAVGVFLGIPLGKYLGIQPEVLFTQRGFKGTGKIYGLDYELARTLNYFDVPIFIAIKPNKMLTLLMGPQFSFLTSQSDKFTNNLVSIVQTQAFDGESFRKNTLCFVIGLDCNIDRVILGARLGIDALNNNSDENAVTPRYRNAWAQATIGFRLL
jgi:hypothetical protein